MRAYPAKMSMDMAVDMGSHIVVSHEIQDGLTSGMLIEHPYIKDAMRWTMGDENRFAVDLSGQRREISPYLVLGLLVNAPHERQSVLVAHQVPRTEIDPSLMERDDARVARVQINEIVIAHDVVNGGGGIVEDARDGGCVGAVSVFDDVVAVREA